MHLFVNDRPVRDRLLRHALLEAYRDWLPRGRFPTALLFLEMSRPLNYVGSQVMHFFQPIVSAIFDAEGYEQLTRFLEHRGSLDYLCGRIEHFEKEYERREKPANDSEPERQT